MSPIGLCTNDPLCCLQWMWTIVVYPNKYSIMSELTIGFDSTVDHPNDVVVYCRSSFVCFHCVCLFGSVIDPGIPPIGWDGWGPSQEREDERK